jgi:hypothetical protein
MEDAVHGVVDYGHSARETISAACAGGDRRIYIPSASGKH